MSDAQNESVLNVPQAAVDAVAKVLDCDALDARAAVKAAAHPIRAADRSRIYTAFRQATYGAMEADQRGIAVDLLYALITGSD